MNTPRPLDALIARAAQNPVALARLAGILLHKGERDRAQALALEALQAAPGDAEVRNLAAFVLSQGVPAWHFGLVRDTIRNAAYEAAIKRAVKPGMRVLEIGTGSGILAMMAARAGAAQVTTCEMVPSIAAAAAENVARNGLSGRVRVVARKSYDLDVEADMGGRADIFVSEIVSSTILSEDALPVTEHAVRELLKPGAQIIPARGAVRVALAYDSGFDRMTMGTVSGFDLSAFNRLTLPFRELPRGGERLTLASEPADLFDFDFQSGGPFAAAAASVQVRSTGGAANGIVQWIGLQLDGAGSYENNPVRGETSAWAVIFWPFAAPRQYAPGQAVTVSGQHDRHTLRVWA
jgi:protein arginine N-methyltransferase 7